jgi:hypothetical protein
MRLPETFSGKLTVVDESLLLRSPQSHFDFGTFLLKVAKED